MVLVVTSSVVHPNVDDVMYTLMASLPGSLKIGKDLACLVSMQRILKALHEFKGPDDVSRHVVTSLPGLFKIGIDL